MHTYQADLEKAEKDLAESKKVSALAHGGRAYANERVRARDCLKTGRGADGQRDWDAGDCEQGR